MEAAIRPKGATAEPERDLIRRWIEIWVSDCNEFRRWERQELILKEPSPEMIAEHAKKSQMFILSARLLQALMANSDHAAPDLRTEVAAKVRQLEEMSEMIHNPMGDAEANAVLQKAFPNGSGTGKSS